MEWLNYHHLLYFWTVAREGSITAASKRLSLAPSTISGQIGQLEAAFERSLFKRTGRNLTLTAFGHKVLRYADEIFTTGQELIDFVKGRPVSGPIRFDVGVTEVVPKLVVRRLIEPALVHDAGVHLVIREGRSDVLMADLALHHLDVVITDQAAGPDARVRAFNHLLGESDIALFAKPALAARLADGFPGSLTGAPMLLPTTETVLRRQLDLYFDRLDIHPVVMAEFQDMAQLKSFGENGLGAFAAPEVIGADLERQHRVQRVGTFEGLREKYYAISIERKLKHPCLVSLYDRARTELFGRA